MTLEQLLRGIDTTRIVGGEPSEISVADLTMDSRNAGAGSVFVALKGTTVDGHEYINQLLDKGIAAFVVEEIPKNIDIDANTFVVVKDTHRALGILASNFFDNPSSKLQLVGVTGTNGKTTIATLIYKMCMAMGVKAGLLSTVANYVDTEQLTATHTTPDPITINRLLKQMVDKGCRVAAMEVSSHAAQQQRISGLTFSGGVFTNLTRDHLDYHNTFANYRDAKKIFFDILPATAFALINTDDKNARFMVQNTKAKVYTYALKQLADFKAQIVEKNVGSTIVKFNGHELATHFSGVFNIYNLDAVFGSLVLMGFDVDETLVNLSAMTPVAGRFQTHVSTEGIVAIVDYAHTPDALENVLNAINEVKNRNQRVITVVGCGGNRDKGKRPMMARIAAEKSDIVILTSDNPRFEEPTDILNDMLQGVENITSGKVTVNADRRHAIATAAMMAHGGDIILVAGKGHEDYQEINGVKHHFSDIEEIEKILK